MQRDFVHRKRPLRFLKISDPPRSRASRERGDPRVLVSAPAALDRQMTAGGQLLVGFREVGYWNTQPKLHAIYNSASV